MRESPTGDIPQWATEQIRSGLKLEGHANIRSALDSLSLEYVIDFFKGEKDIPKNTAKTAYAIAMYQKALLLLGYSPLIVDGLYKMKNPKNESETKKMIRKFQIANTLENDGIPGPDTAKKIYEALLIHKKPIVPKIDKKIKTPIIPPREKIEKETPHPPIVDGSYFQFANSTPLVIEPTPVEKIEPTVTIEESTFWNDMISGFKSRFVWKK